MILHIFLNKAKKKKYFSKDFLCFTKSFFNAKNESSFNEVFYDYLQELSDHFDKIEHMDPKRKCNQNTPLRKKIATVFSELILKVFFLSLSLTWLEEKEIDPHSPMQKRSTQNESKSFVLRDLLIFNYNEIFPVEILLLYIITQYFKPIPLGVTKSEAENLKKRLLIPQKEALFDLLQKLVLKRPDDFQEESLGYKIFETFAKFLKTKEKNQVVFELNKLLKKVVIQCKFPCLENEYMSFGQNRKELVELFYQTKFNDFSPQEIVKTLTIIDLKMLFNFNKNTQNKISKKNEKRYNFFINFLVINVILNPNMKRQCQIIENYYKIADILYREKNYSSLLIFFTCLSKLDLILPKTMKNLGQIQKNHMKESNFFGTLLDGSYEQISNKWKSDLDKNFLCLPFLNYYQRHLNFTNYKHKENYYLDLGKMKKVTSCFNEIHDIKNIWSKKIYYFLKDFIKNELYYFLRKDYKIILQRVIPNLHTISNQELDNIVWNQAEELEKVKF